MKTYLQVPYHQNDVVKRLGGRFDHEKRKWYCPDGADLSRFAEWVPKELQPWLSKKPVVQRKKKKKGKQNLVSGQTIGFTRGIDCPIDFKTGEILHGNEVDLTIAPWEQNPLSHLETSKEKNSKSHGSADLGLAGLPW